MGDKKNIDRFFRDKLKNFEATPNDSVWENISTELENIKKSKRGIPLWYKLAGTAAALLLVFTISQFTLNKDTPINSQETIVDVELKEDVLNSDLENGTKRNDNVISELDAKNNLEKNQTKASALTPQNSKPNTIIQTDKINKTSKTVIVRNNIKKEENKPSNIYKNELGINPTNQTNNSVVSNLEKENNSESSKNALAISPSRQVNNAIEDNHNSSLIKDGSLDGNVNKEKNNTFTNSQKNNSSEKLDSLKTYLADKAISENLTNSEESNELKEEGKLSLVEEVTTNQEIVEVDETKEEFERWKVASFIAPVYFNTLGDGSSIHPQFDNNSKSGDINMSYGVSGSYAINKKLSIRSGISKLKLGYSTNNIIVYDNVGNSDGGLLRNNIELTESAQNLLFISANEFNFTEVPGIFNDFIESSIDQKLGFIEIPLELEYKISDRKMSINLIGGFSTLFLNENEVYSVLEGNTTLLGKATNINKTSFSANFGMGFDFKISNKFNLNLEPVFKYQLNTFNNTSGDFKPYFIGVYSGLSFKF